MSGTAELLGRVYDLERRLDNLDAVLDHVEELVGALEDPGDDPAQWPLDTPVLALEPRPASLEELRRMVPACHRPQGPR